MLIAGLSGENNSGQYRSGQRRIGQRLVVKARIIGVEGNVLAYIAA